MVTPIDSIEALKKERLNHLFMLRRIDKQSQLSKNYKQVGDFHNGVYDELGYVSPWTAAAHNLNAKVMIIGQDWSSEDKLSEEPKDPSLGLDPKLPTNYNLKNLLRSTFNLDFSEVYATNLFVFIKPGNLSSRIPLADLVYSAKKYTLPQIEIVEPLIVLCLGSAAYNGLSKALLGKQKKFKDSWRNPILHGTSKIFGIPHPGGLGIRNAGGFDKVLSIWQEIAQQTNSFVD